MKITLNIREDAVESLAEYFKALRLCGQRPNNPAEALAARIIIACGKGEAEINVTKTTLDLIIGA